MYHAKNNPSLLFTIILCITLWQLIPDHERYRNLKKCNTDGTGYSKGEKAEKPAQYVIQKACFFCWNQSKDDLIMLGKETEMRTENRTGYQQTSKQQKNHKNLHNIPCRKWLLLWTLIQDDPQGQIKTETKIWKSLKTHVCLYMYKVLYQVSVTVTVRYKLYLTVTVTETW